MTTDARAHLLNAVSRLVTPELHGSLADLYNKLNEAKDLFKELVKRQWLTPYQANQLSKGLGEELVLGSYVLLDRLGRGGMGEVFRARHNIIKRCDAVKIISTEFLKNKDSHRRFLSEIETAAKLSHANLVQTYNADYANGRFFLAMELIDGVSISRLVEQQGVFSEREACDIIFQTAQGLQHIHEKGLAHRDLKPSNLMLSGTALKIVDLGLARLRDRQRSTDTTRPGAIEASVDFLAPEQALNANDADIRADIYSLGCILYFLLEGTPPFPGDNPAQVLAAHQSARPTPLSRNDLNPRISYALQRMLRKSPAHRYQTPQEVVDYFEPLRHHVQGAAAPRNVLDSARSLVSGPAEEPEEEFSLVVEDSHDPAAALPQYVPPPIAPNDHREPMVHAPASRTVAAPANGNAVPVFAPALDVPQVFHPNGPQSVPSPGGTGPVPVFTPVSDSPHVFQAVPAPPQPRSSILVGIIKLLLLLVLLAAAAIAGRLFLPEIPLAKKVGYLSFYPPVANDAVSDDTLEAAVFKNKLDKVNEDLAAKRKEIETTTAALKTAIADAKKDRAEREKIITLKLGLEDQLAAERKRVLRANEVAEEERKTAILLRDENRKVIADAKDAVQRAANAGGNSETVRNLEERLNKIEGIAKEKCLWFLLHNPNNNDLNCQVKFRYWNGEWTDWQQRKLAAKKYYREGSEPGGVQALIRWDYTAGDDKSVFKTLVVTAQGFAAIARPDFNEIIPMYRFEYNKAGTEIDVRFLTRPPGLKIKADP